MSVASALWSFQQVVRVFSKVGIANGQPTGFRVRSDQWVQADIHPLMSPGINRIRLEPRFRDFPQLRVGLNLKQVLRVQLVTLAEDLSIAHIQSLSDFGGTPRPRAKPTVRQ